MTDFERLVDEFGHLCVEHAYAQQDTEAVTAARTALLSAHSALAARVVELEGALKNLADEFVRVYPIYYYAEPWGHKTNAPLIAARAALSGAG